MEATLIRNGLVIDPCNGINWKSDVLFRHGVILSVGPEAGMGSVAKGADVIDVDGCIVCPGLVDCHVHVYEHATPLGVNPDESCLRRGVTTVVDAGSTGASTFLGLKKYVIDTSKTTVLCFLNIASHGLASAGCSGGAPGGENDSLNQVNVKDCVECLQRYPDDIVGVKVRLCRNITDQGRVEEEVFRRALKASEKSGKPLMVHHTESTIPNQGTPASGLCIPGSLKPGDILTHMYHAYGSTIIDEQKRKPHPGVTEAQQRGVYLDIGHGQGAFNWTVAEICSSQNLWPDIISSDNHKGNINGPCYDLVTVMTKLLHLGMPLIDTVKAVTWTPAQSIHQEDKIGSLSLGSKADITILKIVDCDLELEDCQGQVRTIRKRLEPKLVFKGGERVHTTEYFPFPNRSSQIRGHGTLQDVLIHD